jgi:hypothetical protein
MQTRLPPATALAVTGLLAIIGCGDGPTNPGGTTTTTTTSPPQSEFQVQTLITVYTRAQDDAQWTEGTVRDDRVAQILLGVEMLEEGTTSMNNEGERDVLQAAIDRVNAQFTDADYRNAFGETKENLLRFLNDADSDGWSIDGRHGEGRDWPYDSDGNDPDGWTGQIVVTVTRP